MNGMAKIWLIEKIYRSETSHFKSEQYKNTGTIGMEAFGKPPYYGWAFLNKIPHICP